ncbi:MAG: hypothetical protein JWR18_4230 [Segetibacter sp.]|jgi:ferritin-like metal-binding protein YciE|nr:hypothetical protein [Segetibacter sp.]
MIAARQQIKLTACLAIASNAFKGVGGIIFLIKIKKIIMEKMNDLKALLQHEVEDLISVEDQIIEAMPAMIEKVQNNELKKALQQHLTVTEKQRTRLDQVKKLVTGKPQKGEESKGFLSGLFEAISSGDKCKGMEGIITEGQKIMKADMDADVKDAAIIAAAQKIEHYEICGYGTARAYAMQLNMKEAESLLQQTLDEEYAADDLLTKLAYSDVNEKAESTDDSASRRQAGSAKNNGQSNKTAAAKKSGQNIKGANKAVASEAPKKAAAKKAPAKAENSQPKKAAAKSAAPKKAAAKKSSGKK